MLLCLKKAILQLSKTSPCDPIREIKKMESAWSWKAIFLVNVFLACVSFSIVLPSLWPYLQTVRSLRFMKYSSAAQKRF